MNAASKTICLDSLVKGHDNKKGLGLSIDTKNGIIAVTGREKVDAGVRNAPIRILGKFLHGPLQNGNVELGKGELLLKNSAGPAGQAVFYKFRLMSGAEKAEALLEFGK